MPKHYGKAGSVFCCLYVLVCVSSTVILPAHSIRNLKTAPAANWNYKARGHQSRDFGDGLGHGLKSWSMSLQVGQCPQAWVSLEILLKKMQLTLWVVLMVNLEIGPESLCRRHH